MMWRIRQLFSQMIPIALVAAVAWGGYHLYRQGTFRGGVGSSISRMAGKVPFFGSAFRSSPRRSYSRGSSVARGHRKFRKARRGHGRRHRR